MNKLLSLLFFLTTLTLSAQEFSVGGTLLDSSSQQPLEAATVYVESVKDSTLIAYTITDGEGAFKLEGKTSQTQLQLFISFVGYKQYSSRLNLEENREISLKTISLTEQEEQLEDVVVKGRSAPIVFKKDTIEFNTASFRTRPDANIEDLLKELPGFSVDTEGKITFNGKPVNKVLVNGKEFFGNDPTIATQNLTKEMVKKIQVMDSRTKKEVFTNQKSDGKSKTVNLQLDKDKNSGFFGSVDGGYGTDDRYDAKLFGNYFKDDLRLGIVAGGNNVNAGSKDFSRVPGYIGNPTGSGGITDEKSISVNFSDDWGSNTSFLSPYSSSFRDTENESKNRTTSQLANGDAFTTTNQSNSVQHNDSHNFNSRFETTIDSLYLVELNSSFTYSNNESESGSEQQSFSGDDKLKNSSSNSNYSKQLSKTGKADLSITRKYGNKGGFFTLKSGLSYSGSENDALNLSTTNFYSDIDSTIDSTLVRDQTVAGNQKATSQNYALQWHLPLIKNKLFLETAYRAEVDERKDKNLVFDTEEQLVTAQSTDFKNQNLEHRPELGLRYQSGKLRFKMQGNINFLTLKSQDNLRDFDFRNTFNLLGLDASGYYKLSPVSGMTLGYTINNSTPSIAQLSPYVDISDPLHIKRGNPDLDPEIHKTLKLHYSKFNPKKNTNFSVLGLFSSTKNAITAKSVVDEDLIRNTTFTNLDGNYNLNVGIQFGKVKKLDSLQNIRSSASLNLVHNKNNNFINEQQYTSYTYSATLNLGLNYSVGRKHMYALSYGPRYGGNFFNIDNLENNSFINHFLQFSTINTFGKLEIKNNLSYSYNTNIAPGFQKGSLFWNSSLNLSVLDKKGTISLAAYDLLNQNTNSSRRAVGESIIDTQSTVLRQYFMLGFRYSFNKMEGKSTRSFTVMRMK